MNMPNEATVRPQVPGENDGINVLEERINVLEERC